MLNVIPVKLPHLPTAGSLPPFCMAALPSPFGRELYEG